MMSWYEIIKQQWEWGCYTDPSQLDIYVQAGWITEEEKQEIITPDPVPDYPEGEPTEDNSGY